MRIPRILLYAYAFIAIATLLIVWRGGGHFTYVLDDTYIHMALAKHLVEDGVWGVTPHAPSASSSSILWPLILSALVYLLGPAPMIPYFLSLAIATGLLWWLDRQVRATVKDPEAAAPLVLFAAFASCMTFLVFIGMEHVLQVWVSLGFAWRAASVLADPSPTFRRAWPLIVLAPILSATRYEGLFLVAPVCVLLALRGGPRQFLGRGLAVGCAICAGALVPVVIFGIAMHRLDLPFLPHSVQLKALVPHVAVHGHWLHFGPKFILNALVHPELTLLLCAAIYSLRARRKAGGDFWTVPALLQAIFAAATLLHLEFAATGPFTRYIAYLTALGVVALGLEAGPLFRAGFRLHPRSPQLTRGRRYLSRCTWGALLIMAAFCHLAVPQMSQNIYGQQIQMARFLGTYYNGQGVALNDIGTSAFFTEIKMVDIFGLASREVAEARLRGEYGQEEIDRITREADVQVAIVYENWFQTLSGTSLLPGHWEKVGTWKIPFNIVCGWHTVAIFAVDPEGRDRLVENLIEFSGQLPRGVEQRGAYMDGVSDGR